jgi:hypothetical protein
MTCDSTTKERGGGVGCEDSSTYRRTCITFELLLTWECRRARMRLAETVLRDDRDHSVVLVVDRQRTLNDINGRVTAMREGRNHDHTH